MQHFLQVLQHFNDDIRKPAIEDYMLVIIYHLQYNYFTTFWQQKLEFFWYTSLYIYNFNVELYYIILKAYYNVIVVCINICDKLYDSAAIMIQEHFHKCI